MGQCHSDFDVTSHHSGTSLPPTLETLAKPTHTQELSGNSLSYSPPVLTPRNRNVLLSKEVFTSLSPPQSPNIVVPFRVPLSEEEMPPMKNEENSTETAFYFGESILMASEESSKRAFTESIFIDVIDIQSKLPVLPGSGYNTEKTSAAEKAEQMVSPPVPFQKQKVCCNRDLANNNTKQLVLQAPEVEQKEAKTTEPVEPISQMIMADGGEAKIEATFKCTLRVMFACYIIGIAFFFVMCRNAFTKQEVSNAPILNEMSFLPAPEPEDNMKRKDRFRFLHEMKQNVAHLGEFSMQQDAHALLPLLGMKQHGGTEHAVETIQAELEAIHDIVLI